MPFLIPILASLVLTNAADVTRAIRERRVGERFHLEGLVTYAYQEKNRQKLMLEDASGIVPIRLPITPLEDIPFNCTPGETVRITGKTSLGRKDSISARGHTLALVSRGLRPVPPEITIKTLKTGAFDNRYVRVRGTVRDIFRDEIDRDFAFLVLYRDGRHVYATYRIPDADNQDDFAFFQSLLGADITVTGLIGTNIHGCRRLLGRGVSLHTRDEITVNIPPPEDPFDAPGLPTDATLNPEDVAKMGRHHVSGHVIAVRGNGLFFLREEDGTVRKIDCDNLPVPPYGAYVEVVGHPETDLYRINLSSAIWRPANGKPLVVGPPQRVTARQIFTNDRGESEINPTFHGTLISFSGTILDLPFRDNRTIIVKSDSFPIPVELGTAPFAATGLSAGSTVEITGVCIIESQDWNPYSSFPHITGVTVVPRNASDIRLLSAAPWWTTKRLLTVILALVAALICIFLWNRFLRRLVERRGRQLFREQVARIGSELRVGERTRLAVELHDSLSQNLTGISFQIDMANRLSEDRQERLRKHLSIAAKTLLSCREELRNCIYDLRNQALDEHEMDEAIRISLRPHLGTARLAVRFNIPRTRLSDPTAHAILRIIRELATNAIRHGGAKSIAVAGAIDRNHLLVSVRDDGCGFDPDSRPRLTEGHFGLHGISERIRQFNGTMRIESTPGRGTRVEIALELPRTDDKGRNVR